MPHMIEAEWLLILICAPSVAPNPAGVLLFDRSSNEIFFRLKENLQTGDEDVDLIWPQFAEELRLRTGEEGAEAVFSWLETDLSNVFRISDPQTILAQDVAHAIDALYEKHVTKGESVSHSA